MILVDANIILYAEDSLSENHEAAREWWDAQLSGVNPVGLCWPVLSAFMRISTNPRLHQRPLTTKEATRRIGSWLDQPCVQVIEAGPDHWRYFRALLEQVNATGNLVSDAHLAALSQEVGGVVCSTDRDFAMFPKIKWKNPLSSH
ncbi:MAG: TA system VapC family ribonuclease toxin [Verrucomicrobiae bacterium]|nr:TA system VapC family ribonuclease toxin [Verrucomicrobiae bacterium]